MTTRESNLSDNKCGFKGWNKIHFEPSGLNNSVTQNSISHEAVGLWPSQYRQTRNPVGLGTGPK